MIPVADSVKTRRTPYVNLSLILICIAVFVYELTLSTADLNQFFLDYGVIPAEIDAWLGNRAGVEAPLTIATSAFVHGGFLHLGFNMLFLWVFGDNIEDALGHVPYLVFYLVCATGAAALQVAAGPDSVIPIIGASGAIAGVLGAYLVLYPRATVAVLLPFFFFIPVPVPAFVLLIFWFALQLFIGISSIGMSEVSQGVAVWAHVGGFVTGVALIMLLRPLIRRRPYRRRRGRTQMY